MRLPWWRFRRGRRMRLRHFWMRDLQGSTMFMPWRLVRMDSMRWRVRRRKTNPRTKRSMCPWFRPRSRRRNMRRKKWVHHYRHGQSKNLGGQAGWSEKINFVDLVKIHLRPKFDLERSKFMVNMTPVVLLLLRSCGRIIGLFWSIYKKTLIESPKVTLWFSLYPNWMDRVDRMRCPIGRMGTEIPLPRLRRRLRSGKSRLWLWWSRRVWNMQGRTKMWMDWLGGTNTLQCYLWWWCQTTWKKLQRKNVR